MSETPVSGNPESYEERLLDALSEFTGCIGAALEGICSFSLTIGETYVPFTPDPDEQEADSCEEDDEGCNQVWVRVISVEPRYVDDASFERGDCGAVMAFSLEVGVLRCMEVYEEGEAPTATDVMGYAFQSMSDMRALYCAAMGCEVWDEIRSGTWTPDGPLGGQYGGMWTFTAEL